MGRYALIIGTDAYTDEKLSQLKTPTADVLAMADALADKNLGEFDQVLQLINKEEREVKVTIAEFLEEKKPDDLVLIYFSGHGVKDSVGHLYLALKDTISKSTRISATALPSNFVIQQMDACRSKKQILILDCCYSGAFARSAGLKSGEDKAVTKSTFEGEGVGRVVLTASDETQFALEGNLALEQTEFSLFTHYLLEGLKTGAADQDNDGFVSLSEWYEYSFSQVRTVTNRMSPQIWAYRQQGELLISKNPNSKKTVVELPPELLRSLESPFVNIRVGAIKELGDLLRSRDEELVNLARATLMGMVNDDSRKVTDAVSEELKKSKPAQEVPQVSPKIEEVLFADKELVETVFEPVLLPDLKLAKKRKVIEIPVEKTDDKQIKTKKTKAKIAALDEKSTSNLGAHLIAQQIVANKIILPNGMEFMYVPAGKFLMGSNRGENNEKPQHTLDISYGYWMARFPVTNELYGAYTKDEQLKHPVPNWGKKKDHPVVLVSWTDGINYCEWLSEVFNQNLPKGRIFRLPTESEWEKAARGNKGAIYPWGDEFDKNKCNSAEGGKGGTTSVGLYSPSGDSPFSCADMAGNVWEWTHSVMKKYPYNSVDGRESENVKGNRVFRGGSFDDDARNACCVFRDHDDKQYFDVMVGFRVCIGPPLPR